MRRLRKGDLVFHVITKRWGHVTRRRGASVTLHLIGQREGAGYEAEETLCRLDGDGALLDLCDRLTALDPSLGMWLVNAMAANSAWSTEHVCRLLADAGKAGEAVLRVYA